MAEVVNHAVVKGEWCLVIDTSIFVDHGEVIEIVGDAFQVFGCFESYWRYPGFNTSASPV